MLLFLEPKVKLAFRFFRDFTDSLWLPDSSVSNRTSLRLHCSGADPTSGNRPPQPHKPRRGMGKTAQGSQASTFSGSVNAPFLFSVFLINYLCISSGSQQQLPLLLSPAVPIGKSTATTFPSLSSASGDSGKPMGALIIWQPCCPSGHRSVVGVIAHRSVWGGKP